MKYLNNITKVLIGSPISRNREILLEFLSSLKSLDKTNLDIYYYFVDDNNEIDSSTLLKNFEASEKNVKLVVSSKTSNNNYIHNDYTHIWNNSLIEKISTFKNNMIQYAIANSFDYLFLIDSDIILNYKVLKQLINDNKDIISNIFWTKWTPDSIPSPQVWLQDEYNFFISDSQNLSEQDKLNQYYDFINKIKIPGIYKVGGLGACTLISKNALLKGVNFNRIYNLSFWGEDRHFCIRAAALGLELFVDTTYPAYHVYRNSDIQNISVFKGAELINNADNLILTAIPSIFIFHNIDHSNFFTEEASTKILDFIKVEYSLKNKQIIDCQISNYSNSPFTDYTKLLYQLSIKLSYKTDNDILESIINARLVLTKEDNNPLLISHFLI